jgi:polysaccharide export outer membrane protein
MGVPVARKLLLATFLILLAGSAAWTAESEIDGTLTFVAAAEPETFGPAYRIGPGDLLGIEVLNNRELTRAVIVLPDGKIVFPLIGEIVAGGKTVGQLKKEIEEKLSRYVEPLILFVEVRQVNSMYIYVLGRVNTPGRVVLNGNVDVLQALAIAGGPNAFANRSDIRVFRREGGGTVTIPFDYDEVTAGRKLETNIMLKRGDVIFVP